MILRLFFPFGQSTDQRTKIFELFGHQRWYSARLSLSFLSHLTHQPINKSTNSASLTPSLPIFRTPVTCMPQLPRTLLPELPNFSVWRLGFRGLKPGSRMLNTLKTMKIHNFNILERTFCAAWQGSCIIKGNQFKKPNFGWPGDGKSWISKQVWPGRLAFQVCPVFPF